MAERFKMQFNSRNNIVNGNSKIEVELSNVLDDIDNRLSEINAILFETEKNINQLINQGDSVNNITALICGLVSGIIDIAFIREWDFSKAKAWSNKEVSERVVAFAQRHPEYQKIMAGRSDVNQDNRLFHALKFLEKKYPLPGDGDWQYEGSSITAKSHHLDDFCHHPTIIGLVQLNSQKGS